MLAYTPFIDPLDLHGVWYLLLPPLAILIAIAYKAVRIPDLTVYWKQTLLFALQILIGIVGLYVLALLLVRFALPGLL
ncbi:MAG: hypothetical protein AAGI53_04010 [Planctomycetota bacterium]